jgi:hypothetical protein
MGCAAVTRLDERSGISILEFPWAVQDTPTTYPFDPAGVFSNMEHQTGHGKLGLGPSSVHNGHAFLDARR